MTLQDMLGAVYADVGQRPDPGAVVASRVTRYLNEAVQVILSEPGMDRLLDSDPMATFTSVANQARYALPDVAAIRHVYEQTNDRLLGILSLSDYRRDDPDPTSHTGIPSHVVPIGRVAVATLPSAACELFIVSTSAADTGTAFVTGTVTGGYTRTAAVRMTGVTAVSLSTLITTWIDVTDLYLSQAAVGTVTLHSVSGIGTELAQITIGQTRQNYLGFYLWPTPSSAITYLVDYRKAYSPMLQKQDEPPLPKEFHPMVPAYARMREWEGKAETDRLIMAKQQWDRWLSRLKYAVRNNPDELPVTGRRSRRGFSRLGSWTPADSW